MPNVNNKVLENIIKGLKEDGNSNENEVLSMTSNVDDFLFEAALYYTENNGITELLVGDFMKNDTHYTLTEFQKQMVITYMDLEIEDHFPTPLPFTYNVRAEQALYA